MTLSNEMAWTFVGIGLAFLFWGADKIFDTFTHKYSIWMKRVTGVWFFVFGVLIFYILFSSGNLQFFFPRIP